MNIDKFDQALSPDFASGFEESVDCFAEITTKAAALLDAEKCFLFIKDDNEQKLYTFIADNEGVHIRATKPIDRGIAGTILSEPTGYTASKAAQSERWCQDLDELPGFVTTSYLAWPIWDFSSCKSIGVVEFRNKGGGSPSSFFSAADSQFARIIALQLGHAIIHYKQQELIAGHTEAINKAYEKNFDQGETIDFSSGTEFDNARKAVTFSPGSARAAFRIAKQPSLFDARRSSVSISDRAWDYDVFLQSEESLMMHAIDIFDERGLFSRFSIPMTTFVNFVGEIKQGYDKRSPYHNSYHAFDVMHVCYLLMTKCRADEYLESFNTLSILVAALAHDLGHDGYNNAFHSNTDSELAVTYNNISILENYSAAYLFRILRKPENNIFARLDAEEMAKMRTRLIDMILDTDAKNHFMLMTRFKHGLEMKKLSRGLLSSMILHVSDVSNPARPGRVARKWAYAVQREFFRQGDREKELGLPQSPFMDREFENLPRMQEAFIDAVVHPVFRLLADFLPLVEEKCIKSLQLNRAFWQNMLHRGILKTDDVITFLEKQEGGSFILPQIEHQDDGNASVFEGDGNDHAELPIPGIPANATKNHGETGARRASLISIDTTIRNNDDPELGNVDDCRDSVVKPCQSFGYSSMVHSSEGCLRTLHTTMSKLLESPAFQILTFLATLYALFAFDLNAAVGEKSSDGVIDQVTLVVLIIFLIELLFSLICVPGYIQFFFWLDLIASISLYLEIGFLVQMGPEIGDADNFALAKAGRAAKAGARAGRLASILRVIRLVKVFKLAQWALERVTKKRVDHSTDKLENELHFSMSIIGKRMTESITKKVIIAVVLMLIMFSATDVNYTPDARQFQLDTIAEFPDSTSLIDSFFDSHDNIVAFSAPGYEYKDQDRINVLRETEILVLNSTVDESTTAIFDISGDVESQAWYSLLITSFVTLLLAGMGLLFSRDAYKMVIHPIEKMKHTVQHLSENPLLHLERIKKRNNSESTETDMLAQAITKMAALLQVGFGSAGAEIIAKNLSDMGELNPMIPGVRVNAIFGFCDIRDFTFATEGLQQDVMIFVNKIARIAHTRVVESGGHPNKNIGDAFLLVWKLKSGKNTNSSGDLQKEMYDAALTCVQNIIQDLRDAGSLGSFLQDDMSGMSPAWTSTLESYKVAMGFGLHKGWAIEGAIGSKLKIDASYLSPHVNLASRLEAATKQYSVNLLMSDAFFGGLSGSLQSTCRRCDKVIFKGSTEPMVIYHQDTEPLSSLNSPPRNSEHLLDLTTWDAETDQAYNGLINDAKSKLSSERELVQREVYDALFNSYLDRDWNRCKIFCHLWMKKFPGDPVVICMVNHLSKYHFQCPESWPGFHELTEK
jgi:class 3 adenylate cyclase